MSFKEKMRNIKIEIGKFYTKLSYVLLPLAIVTLFLFAYVQIDFFSKNIYNGSNIIFTAVIAGTSTLPFLPFILPAFFAIRDGTDKDYIRLFWVGTFYLPLLIWLAAGLIL